MFYEEKLPTEYTTLGEARTFFYHIQTADWFIGIGYIVKYFSLLF